jgi:drug/metabolite transporter (DMT)-like permease
MCGILSIWTNHQNMPKKNHFLLILAVAFLGGSIPPFAKIALEGFEPFTITFLRFLSAAFVIYFFLPRRELSFATLYKLRWVGVVGALNPIFILLALQYIPANIVGLFYAVIPGLSVAYLWLVQKSKTSRLQLFGFALGLLGVGFISFSTVAAQTADSQTWLGTSLAAIAVLSFFAYGIISKEHQRSESFSAAALAFYFAIITALLSLPLALYETTAQSGLQNVSVNAAAAVFFLGVIGTGAQYLLYQHSLRVMEASQANIFIYLSPLVAAGLAAIMLEEQITWQLIAGGIVILYGAYLATGRRRPVIKTPAEA